MVMVEGVATSLDPDINMWETSKPFVGEWLRSELGPEAAIADRLRDDLQTLLRLPELVRRLEAELPNHGAAPPAPPLRDVDLVSVGNSWKYWLTALLGIGFGAAGSWLWL